MSTLPPPVLVAQPLVALRAIHKHYARSPLPALEDVAMEVARGEVFGVIGRSGAGKSTLLRLFNRLEVPTSGLRFWKICVKLTVAGIGLSAGSAGAGGSDPKSQAVS